MKAKFMPRIKFTAKTESSGSWLYKTNKKVIFFKFNDIEEIINMKKRIHPCNIN